MTYKKFMLAFLFLLVLTPVAQAGVIEDSIDWLFELFGSNYEDSLNYADYKGYIAYTDQEKYYWFADYKGDYANSEWEYFNITNTNDFRDVITSIDHDVNIDVAQLKKYQGINYTWETVNLNPIENGKRVSGFEIESMETLEFRFKYKPSKTDGKVSIYISTQKVGDFFIDPLYNLTSRGVYLGEGRLDSTGTAGIVYHKGNYYVAGNTGMKISNYTANDGVFVNNITADCGAGAVTVSSLAGNESKLYTTGTNGVGTYWICENNYDGSNVVNLEIQGVSTNLRSLGENETDVIGLNVDNAVAYIFDKSNSLANLNSGSFTDVCLTSGVGEQWKGITWNGINGWYVVEQTTGTICNISGDFTQNLSMSDDFAGLNRFGMGHPSGLINNTYNGYSVVDLVDDFVYELTGRTIPTIDNLTLIPEITYANQSINCSLGFTSDYDLSINFSWLRNDVIQFSYNDSIPSSTRFLSYTLDPGNFTKKSLYENWTCSGSLNDGFNVVTLSNQTNISSLIIVNSNDYEPDVVTGQQTLFSTNITLLDGTLNFAYLYYDGLNFSGSILNTGENYVVTKTITVPEEQLKVNNTFYWDFITTYQDSNTSRLNQSVDAFNIGRCNSTYDFVLINYSLVDEETKVMIDNTSLSTNVQYDIVVRSNLNSSFNYTTSDEFVNVTWIQVCSPFNLTNSSATFRLDATTRYEVQNHVTEYHYFDNLQLTNTTAFQNVILYSLLATDSTSFIINYFDEFYLGVEDAIVEVWREYVGDGEFKLVEMGKTDPEGQTNVHLVTEDETYFFIVRKNGTLLKRTPEYTVICQTTPCQINIYQQTGVGNYDNFDKFDNLEYSLDADEDTNTVTFTFTTDDGTAQTLNLEIIQFDNYMNKSVSNQTITNNAGTLSYTLPTSLLNETYYVVAKYNGQIVGYAYLDTSESPNDIFGFTGLSMAVLSVMTLTLMAVSTGVGVIVFSILGLVFAGISGILDIPWFTLIWLICAGAIIIFKIARRQSTP